MCGPMATSVSPSSSSSSRRRATSSSSSVSLPPPGVAHTVTRGNSKRTRSDPVIVVEQQRPHRGADPQSLGIRGLHSSGESGRSSLNAWYSS